MRFCAALTALYGLPRASLRPLPPGASKHKDVRSFHIHEDDPLDEVQFQRLLDRVRYQSENGDKSASIQPIAQMQVTLDLPIQHDILALVNEEANHG
jgi:hypothetical protein